jgi:Arc/MetJ-type ribon-helix-helix transcriptional regulator
MANINIRIDDKLEIELKKRAKESGYKTLSDYIRSILKENHQEEQLSRVTIEAEIEKLEKTQNQFSEVQVKLLKKYMYDSKFMMSLFYHFMIAAANEETAREAWKQAEADMKKYMEKLKE